MKNNPKIINLNQPETIREYSRRTRLAVIIFCATLTYFSVSMTSWIFEFVKKDGYGKVVKMP
jgi:hypothetical protein